MRRLLAVLAVVVIAVVLAVPYFAWAGLPENPVGVVVEMQVTARCFSYQGDAYFDVTFTFDHEEHPSFGAYFWAYWGNVIMPAATEAPDEYPFLCLLIQVDGQASTREYWYEPYTYGDVLETTMTYIADHGETLRWSARICFAVSESDYTGGTILVP